MVPRPLLSFLGRLIVVLVLGLVMVDDPQHFDEAESGSQPPQRRLLVGVELGHAPGSATEAGAVAVGPRCR